MTLVGDVLYLNYRVIFLTLLQPKIALMINIVDFKEDPRTPIIHNINIADAYDW
jgi:hypothetical protein